MCPERLVSVESDAANHICHLIVWYGQEALDRNMQEVLQTTLLWLGFAAVSYPDCQGRPYCSAFPGMDDNHF